MTTEDNIYMTIFVNAKTGEVKGAFKAQLDAIPKENFRADLEYLEDIEKGPNLSDVTETYCPIIYRTNPIWIRVGGRLKRIG